jgi:two-component system, NtrC family, sensor histidine kinase PilS
MSHFPAHGDSTRDASVVARAPDPGSTPSPRPILPQLPSDAERPASSRRWRLSRLPEHGTIVGWIYGIRLAVALAVFASVLWVWQQAEPTVTLGAALILLLAGGVTAASFWYTHLAKRLPGRNFLYGQTIFDTLLVTWIVHLTGGADSAFAPLYILVVWAAAILLPFLGGILIAMLASVLYVAEVVWSAQGTLHSGVFLQLVLFSGVALLTGYLGDRLRQTGTALGEAEAQLKLLRLDTTEILDTINTGILTVDGAGRLAYMNPAAAELLSLASDEWVGRPVLERLDQEAAGLGWVIARTQRERRPIARYETEDTHDGSFVLGVSTTLVERAGEGDTAVTAIFQNITEKVRMEQLKRRAERLEALAELSASLAHEIKNPLASIRSAVEQLALPDLDSDDKLVLNRLVVHESTRLSRLLAEFLDFARVEITEPTTMDLRTVVQHAVAVVRQHPDAEQRVIRVRTPEAETPVRVTGDGDLLHRAMLNLVLNAVQWAGPDGEVEVVLELIRSDILEPLHGVRDVARLRVSDTGPGIEPGTAEHVFNPFFTLRPGGTGLGLALVQRAAEAHGGVVFIEDPRPPDAPGAVFTLCLPANGPDTDVDARDAASARPYAASEVGS